MRRFAQGISDGSWKTQLQSSADSSRSGALGSPALCGKVYKGVSSARTAACRSTCLTTHEETGLCDDAMQHAIWDATPLAQGALAFKGWSGMFQGKKAVEFSLYVGNPGW